jgi:hypothetical protein
MISSSFQNWRSQPYLERSSGLCSLTFAEAITDIKAYALQEFDREIVQKQLYYHTREHISGVQRRANLIFQTVRPYWEATLHDGASPDAIARWELLLDLCAVTHDMIQIFVPQSQPYSSRQREAGVSEAATIENVLGYIMYLNQQLQEHCPEQVALFTDTELQIIQDAIKATICAYDPSEQAIYQPALYRSNKPVSLIAQIIALADIGALGIEGATSYHREGSLLFLEENPDIIPLIRNNQIGTLSLENQNLYENLRQRLLKRARFQVSFAKSRLTRCPQELKNLPAEAISDLTDKVFQYLNWDTIQEIELSTPTNDETSLELLISFFKLDKIIDPVET